MRKPDAKAAAGIVKVAGVAVFMLQALNALAVTIPTVSCKTDPSIFNTGINGAATNYASSSPRYEVGLGKIDDHWQRAMGQKNGGTGKVADLTDPGDVSGSNVGPYQDVEVLKGHPWWMPTPFSNANWIALGEGGQLHLPCVPLPVLHGCGSDAGQLQPEPGLLHG